MNWRVLVAVLLIPATAAAEQPPIITHPPGDDKITAVFKGDKVPYDGQLFSPETSIRWAFWLQQYQQRLKADVDKEQAICSVKDEYHDSVLSIEKEKYASVTKDLKDKLLESEKERVAAEEEARNPPWYKTWTFGLILGVVGSAGIFAGSVAALNAVK